MARRWNRTFVMAAALTVAAGRPAPAVPQTLPDVASRAAVAELERLVRQHVGLAAVSQVDCEGTTPRACEARMWKVGGLWVEQRTFVEAVDRGLLPLQSRIDLDVLEWRASLAIAIFLDPGSSPQRPGYAARIIEHTGAVIDPHELHQLGLSELQRLRDEMRRLVQRQRPDADLDTFLDAVRSDPRLFAGSSNELRSMARAVAERIDAAVPRAFSLLPSAPYSIEVRRSRRGLMAYYDLQRDPLRGTIVLNADPSQVPLFLLEALLIHEAVPGHHLQQALAAEQADLPDWRAGYSYTPFVEGWGLYAESLGAELSIYRHPLMEFGRLNLEMWRALRLVVDTGLHAFDWDVEEARELFRANTALPTGQIRVEVQRYADNPGQALAYKLGEQRFRTLRERAEAALGDDFDLRRFHAALLRHGPMPLRTLYDHVDAWIGDP